MVVRKTNSYDTKELRKVQKDLKTTVAKLRGDIKKKLGPKSFSALKNTRSKSIKLSPKLKKWIAKK